MRNPLASPAAMNLGLLLARAPLGVSFILAGFSKFTAAGGVSAFASANSRYVPAYMPAWFGGLYLHALPYVEILVGAMLLLGIFSRVGGLLASLMLVSFMIAVTGFNVPGTMVPHTNLVFLGFTLLLFLAGGGQYSLDRAIWKRGDSESGR